MLHRTQVVYCVICSFLFILFLSIYSLLTTSLLVLPEFLSLKNKIEFLFDYMTTLAGIGKFMKKFFEVSTTILILD